MKKDINILFNKAKNLELQNLPVSTDELASRIEHGESANILKKYNKLFKSTRRIKMIAYSSALITIVASLLMFTSNNINKQQDINNKVNNISINKSDRSGMDLAVDDNITDNSEKIQEEGIKSDTSKNNENGVPKHSMELINNFKGDSIRKKSPDFKWNEISYDQLKDEFQGAQGFNIDDENGKTIAAKWYHTKIEFDDLLKIYQELKDTLIKYNYFGLIGIGYISDNTDFYSKLESGIKLAKNKKNAGNLEKMTELYAMISRKLANNSSGINFLHLTNNELEKIGVSCTDTSYSYIKESICENVDPAMAKGFAENGYPVDNEKPLLVREREYNIWKINENVSNNKWNFGHGIYEKDTSKLFGPMDTCRLEYGELKRRIKYTGWQATDYSRICAVYADWEYIQMGLELSPLLYFDKGIFRNYYNKYRQFNDLIHISNNNYKNPTTIREKDSIGNLYIKAKGDLDRQYNYLISNKLIAVELQIPNIENAKERGIHVSHKMMLFIPNEEFLNALPERYSVPLRKELDAINKIESGEMSIFEACKGLSQQETFYETCRLESDNIKEAKIIPNPAIGHAKIEFFLLQERFLNITMLDMNGRYVNEIRPWQKTADGHYSVDISLKDITPGIYLINITSEKGEKVVQRLVVE